MAREPLPSLFGYIVRKFTYFLTCIILESVGLTKDKWTDEDEDIMKDKTIPYFVIALIISMSIGYLFGWDKTESIEYEEALPVMSKNNVEDEIVDTDFEEVKIKRLNEKAKTYELQVEIPLFGVKQSISSFDEEAEQRIEHFIALLEHSGKYLHHTKEPIL